MEYSTTLAQQIRSVNNRLYKLEHTKTEDGSPFSNLSSEYRLMERYAVERPNTVSGRIYNQDKLINKGQLRLRGTNKKDWDSLSEDEQQALIKVVNNIWNNPDSSTTIGNIKKSYQLAYDTFNKKYSDEHLTEEEYKKIWETVDKIRGEMVIGSDEVMLLMDNYDISYLISQDELENALRRLANDEMLSGLTPSSRLRNRSIQSNYKRRD